MESNALVALEQRFGWPDGAKLVLEWRLMAPSRCWNGVLGALRAPSWPWNCVLGATLVLERRFQQPDGAKLALEWRLGVL